MAYPRKREIAEGIGSNAFEAEVIPLRVAAEVHQQGPYETMLKPILDRLFGITFSILTLPLVLLIVPAIWFTLGSPIVYRQQRVGRFGRDFTVYKFRTMRDDRRSTVLSFPHSDRRENHKSPDDPRHVPLGRFLRKWSLDEIPQFWNIALGDMTLVGPRPELPHIVAKYEPWQHRRHEVKPGLTGLWQVTARGHVPLHEATDIDIDYVENISFLGDFQILLRTPAAALGKQTGG